MLHTTEKVIILKRPVFRSGQSSKCYAKYFAIFFLDHHPRHFAMCFFRCGLDTDSRGRGQRDNQQLVLTTDFLLVTTIIFKVFETNSSFDVKQRTTGKVLISVFQGFFASNNKIFIFEGRPLGYHSIKFRYFPDIS